MTYTIDLSLVEKDLDKLQPDTRRRILRAVMALEDNPRPHGVKKLSDTEALCRIRVGDYRVIYQIRDKVLLVVVVKIGHRREVYQK